MNEDQKSEVAPAPPTVLHLTTHTGDRPSPGPVRPKARPRRKRGLYVAIGCVLALGAFGVVPRLRQGEKLANEVTATRDALPVVSAVKLHWTPGEAEMSLPSNIQAIDQITINARTSGYLQQRFVDIGSRVEKGQLLAIVESPEIDQQVSQSEAEVGKSQAGLGQAGADMDRMRAAISTSQAEASRSESVYLQAKADVSHQQAKETQAEAAVRVATARVSEAKQRLSGAQADLTRARVDEGIALKTLNRWRELEKAQAVSGQEVDERESAYESSRARVEAAQAAVSSAEAGVRVADESVHSAEADVDATKADMESGRQRVQAAQAGISASRSNIQAATASLEASRSMVDSARATIRSTEANRRRTGALQSFEKIVAPFSGVITSRNVEVGDLIGPGSGASGAADQANAVTKSGLFGLARTDELLAQVNVPEDQFAAIRVDQPAEVSVREFPGRVFPGVVFRVSGALDASSRTLLVEVKIPNPGETLKPGVYGQIRFLGADKRPNLKIPANALVFDAKGTRVATVTANGTLHYLPVTVGKDDGDEIEIAEGLTGTETVITNVDSSLSEGARVEVHPNQ